MSIRATTWTTAYASALADPADTPPFLAQPQSFRDQTIRQAVRLRRGGSRLRLVLSNEFGQTPLVVDTTTVSGAQGKPPRTTTLRGSTRWEIPPGQTAASDPVQLPVAAGEEIVVTCYVAGTAGPAAFLPSAQRTGYAAPGNQAARDQLAGPDGPQSFPSLYWIARVLTDAPADGPVIVAFGDSITRGDGTTIDGGQRYPDHLQARMLTVGLGSAVVLNTGLSANRLLLPRVGPPMTERLTRDVLSIGEATHIIITGGLNDIILPAVFGGPQPTAGAISDALFSLARRASRQGIQPVLGTLTTILAARVDAIRADPGDPTRIAPGYDSGDGLHPSDTGARALADAIDLAIFRQDRARHRQPWPHPASGMPRRSGMTLWQRLMWPGSLPMPPAPPVPLWPSPGRRDITA